jgi:O-antigen/teichoic acid export membrane protein
MEAASARTLNPRKLIALRGRTVFQTNSWGLVDQALLSGTNFVTMVLIARTLTPAAFGSFALLYTTLLFTNGLQSTVVTQPHNILGVSRSGSDYRRYTSSTAATQILLAVLTGAVIVAAGVAAALAGASVAPLLFALAAASVAWMTQEFVRRVLYTEGRLAAAVVNDLVSYGGQTIAIAALWRLGHLTAAGARYALAATSALAVALGVWQLRRSFIRAFAREDVRRNWTFGKWLAGAFIAYWFSSQLYLYLAAIVLGTAASGTLKAALVVMGPLNVLLVFIDTTIPIVLARTLDSSGERAMHAQLKQTIHWAAPLVGVYCLAAGVFAGPLLRVFYGHRYENAGGVLALLAIEYFVIFLTRVLAAAIRAKRLTKYVFKANVYSGVVALATGWLIIEVGGVRGAVVGMMLSAAIVGVVLLRGYMSSRTIEAEPRFGTQ